MSLVPSVVHCNWYVIVVGCSVVVLPFDFDRVPSALNSRVFVCPSACERAGSLLAKTLGECRVWRSRIAYERNRVQAHGVGGGEGLYYV